ncbi:glycosyltransferase [Desulfoferrobacter suflitae]|uniref:glycosyltransferase n=1 Tax=Desulfoferrobacter suflitae TaxID=2865782 RepID=UPI00216476C1|nr:glycosyltransferase [Desulfoferrobacter suflitae]MCK8600475.1 glycosyltransferase [Desulfoferrobacter suflitae]
MRIAMLSPIAWRTPPRHYGPWENVVSILTEGLVRRGIDVTLFATKDSQTEGRLIGVSPKGYEEDPDLLPKVWECLHISEAFEQGEHFDLIHNHFDYLPLTYTAMTTTPVVTTIHGFSSPKILPVYQKYNGRTHYVAISEADKNPQLDYIATIHHGIDLEQFTFQAVHRDYLLFFGRIHHEKGARECIEIAQKTGRRLVLAGIVQDQAYFEREVKPHLDNDRVLFAGSAGPEKRNELLGGAYALLHPINFDEPFGLSVVEAMACGTPVIAVNRGSMPEIVADGVTGFLATDAEKMAELVPQVKDLDRLNCRKWVEERFSAERMVEDYLGVYRQIISRSKREDHRPWGFYHVLSDKPDHKVKRITVYPGKRLSYQRHFRRSEHWYIVSGKAVVTRDGEDTELSAGQAIDVPLKSWHRIRNDGREELVFIEVQTGDYFGEDDIERSEDDYGRV